MDQREQWVQLALEEYKTLRTESLQSIDRQQRVLGVGTATAGVLFGLGVRVQDGSAFQATVLMVLIPLVVGLVCMLWIGEMERMVRAGSHIAVLERRLSVGTGMPAPLDWENLLRREPAGRRRIMPVYRAVFGVLFVLTLVSGVLGAETADKDLVGLGLITADACFVMWLARFYVGAEMRLRALGGKRWTAVNLPFAARVTGHRRALVQGQASPSFVDFVGDVGSTPTLTRGRSVPGIMLQAATGRYRTAEPAAPVDCVIALSFGAAVHPGHTTSNRVIAGIAARKYALVPMALQGEVFDALPWQRPVEQQIRSAVPGTYLDTRSALLQAQLLVQRLGARHVRLIVHPHHAPRVLATARKLGMDASVAPESSAVPFDSASTQWWTRSPVLWAIREFPIVLLYRVNQWI